MHDSLPFLTALSGEATTANLSIATVLIASPNYLGSLFDLYVVSRLVVAIWTNFNANQKCCVMTIELLAVDLNGNHMHASLQA